MSTPSFYDQLSFHTVAVSDGGVSSEVKLLYTPPDGGAGIVGLLTPRVASVSELPLKYLEHCFTYSLLDGVAHCPVPDPTVVLKAARGFYEARGVSVPPALDAFVKLQLASMVAPDAEGEKAILPLPPPELDNDLMRGGTDESEG